MPRTAPAPRVKDHTMADRTDGKDFLNRWSARKLDSLEAEKAVAPVVQSEVDAAGLVETGEVAAPPPDLPDIETLDAGSDFRGFLGDNVPRDLAKLAFRKLWRSDPVLANIDGLNDYDEDFSMLGKVAEAFESTYQVGKGHATEEEDDVADEDISETPETEAPDEEVPEEIAAELSSEESAELTGEGTDEMDTPSERQPAKT